MQAYSQHIGEALIPLLGFYYWDWSWYFILLFYIIDALAKSIVLHLKSRKIYQTQGGSTARLLWLKSGSIGAGVDLSILILLHVMYQMNHPEFNIGQEVMAFLQHEEMGLAQGWILIPIVVLGVWLQYKFTFLKLKLHTKTQMSVLWNEQLRYRYLILSVVLLGGVVHYFYHLNDVVFVWVSVLLPFLSSFLFKRSR